MAKLSVIIPSRDERFLVPTIEDLFRNARGEIEVVAVLDSPNWPDNWADVTAKYPNLHTIHNGKSCGMRASINRGVASAISRRAKFIIKTDAHCSFSEGFDEVLKAECEPNWVVVPRRGRLDPEQWAATDTHKPDIDYHYLSFPDDPNDFGGPGLNGKVWPERAIERKDILIDEEMSSQGSCWFMHAKYFNELELMNDKAFGPFWCEMQEIGLNCWLSGGQLMVNKKAKYLHLHKGRKYGRGYKLPESALTQGRTQAMKYLFNRGWAKQTLPFRTLIYRFWPVPTWSDDWEEKLYQGRKFWPLAQAAREAGFAPQDKEVESYTQSQLPQLQIHKAHYGIGGLDDLDVRDQLQSLVQNDSLDIVVNNDTLTPGQNPYRGKKKTLQVQYSINGGEKVTVQRQEKEWLIIGPLQDSNVRGFIEGGADGMRVVIPATALEDHAAAARPVQPKQMLVAEVEPVRNSTEWTDISQWKPVEVDPSKVVKVFKQVEVVQSPLSAAALNDYLIRKFHISDRRLRAPMPVELRDFNRNDLAKLFAELGFTRGAEIGVAEGHYSEILCQSIPNLELLCVDPWHAYSANPQNKSKEKHEFAYSETKRRLEGYNARLDMRLSMDAVRDVKLESLDMVYLDACHSFDFIMSDLIEWSKRVRSGGIVSGDDYYELDRKRWGAGPVEAVQAYTKAHGIALWFICSAPNSVDFFWCKP